MRPRVSSRHQCVIHGDQHGELICKRRDSLYRHRGVRVGEASHPGPISRRRRRVSPSSAEISQQSAPDPILDDLEQDLGTQVDVSSDEVLFTRPNCGRHVVPRIFDASPGATRETTPQVCATELSAERRHATSCSSQVGRTRMISLLSL